MPGTVVYHRAIFLPSTLEDAALTLLVRADGRYRLSAHAALRAREKGVRLPERIPFRQATVVEVTVAAGRVRKFLVRFPAADGVHDVVMSVTADGYVPTVYLNHRRDAHKTLDASRYARAA